MTPVTSNVCCEVAVRKVSILPNGSLCAEVAVGGTLRDNHRMGADQLPRRFAPDKREVKHLEESRLGVAVGLFGKLPFEVADHLCRGLGRLSAHRFRYRESPAS